MIRRLRARLGHARPGRIIARLEARFEDLVSFLEEERGAREAAWADVAGALNAMLLEEEVRPLLTALARDDGYHRRSLFALRETTEYELAFTEPDPLVTVAIATCSERLSCSGAGASVRALSPRPTPTSRSSSSATRQARRRARRSRVSETSGSGSSTSRSAWCTPILTATG